MNYKMPLVCKLSRAIVIALLPFVKPTQKADLKEYLFLNAKKLKKQYIASLKLLIILINSAITVEIAYRCHKISFRNKSGSGIFFKIYVRKSPKNFGHFDFFFGHYQKKQT